jgi:signal transduction histidine kinase
MQTYCAEFTRRTHLPVSFEVDEALPPLPDVYNITLYRVLQEALNNIIKHAQANKVWVDLSMEEDGLVTLTIQDNGIGFEPEKSPSSGMGLTSMNERVSIAGGKLTINSLPKRGTILSAQFTLPAAQTTSETS